MPRIRVMTLDDVPLGMRLKRQAGWNQTEADWRRFLDLQPDGCFVAEVEGEGAGTVTTCVFGDVAWIAMVLVDEAHRGRGVGSGLMRHSLDWLDHAGVRSVRLDATPLGRPIYERLGFGFDYELARYGGALAASMDGGGAAQTPAVGDGVEVAEPTAADLEEALRLDERVTATPRGKLLRRLWSDEPVVVRVALQGGRVRGYVAGRPGEHAWQIGPCIADETAAGEALLRDAARRLAGRRVFVDIPTLHAAASAWAQRAGLTVQRPLFRMTRGPAVREDVASLWASFGPEMG